MSLYNDVLMHYGIIRRSGRYPYGSGENPYQHSGDFLSRVSELRKQGFTYTDKNGVTYKGDTAIAKSFGLSTTDFRAQLSIANHQRRADLAATAKSMQEHGYSPTEIARKMGFTSESSIRNLLKEDVAARKNQAMATADILKKMCDEKGMLDVGAGVEKELGISRQKLDEALAILKEEGYPTNGGRVPQVTNPDGQTTIKVLCPPGTEHKEIYNYENISSVKDYISHDGGATYEPRWTYPKSMDSKRLEICYAEDGGLAKDGVVEIRRGVDDLSLGNSHYAQVRILVDDTHYIKGMAVYSDDLPDGVDVRFNTNKKSGTPVTKVLKPIKDDPTNPFGSLIKDGINDPDSGSSDGGQSWYYDKNGKKQLSLINKRAEEGDWGEWSKKLPSQFLSKQSEQLIKKQLDLSVADKKAEFDEICSLTNPTVKKSLLKSFSDDCDKVAETLEAAALPRQRYQVILPLTTLKDNEVYAPNYEDGETVALIRYPHGGTFEIPILKVNNKNKEARETIGTNAKDAVGITKKNADRLSGADFDGDTVMVIPCNSSKSKVRISSREPFKELVDFDNKLEYGPDSSDPVKTDSKGHTYYSRNGKVYKGMSDTQKQMGVISNLITDMTMLGATDEELTRAVKHSMVVIDAEKHHLDYKQSEIDNGIKALKAKYQGHIADDDRYHEGAGTLLSRAKSQQSVLKRQGTPSIDPETGKYIYKTSDHLTYVDKNGKTQIRMQKSTKMAETDDAFTLVSDKNTVKERAYATYANSMKAMANSARKEMVSTKKLEYSPEAKKTYQKEVDSLNAKLDTALLNAPRERMAQMMANTTVAAKKNSNPDLAKNKKELKKISQQALTDARAQVGAKKEQIKITDKEWEAIQAGAISENQLTQIINNADIDTLRQRAMPRATTALSTAKQSKIKALSNSGYTNTEIAEAMGISTSTVLKYL
jgi:hypothetical protein